MADMENPYEHPDVHLHHDEEYGKKSRKKIWQVFWILLLITVGEFAVAFILPRGAARNITFILMTIVKAFYIVAEFMHLRHEVKSLILTVLIPLTFVVWMVLALLLEGGFYNGGWFG